MSGVTPPSCGSRRIVLATFGSPGDLQPFLAIGAALLRRGHHPVIASSEIYRDQIVGAGLEFSPIRPDRSPGQQDPDFLDRLRRGCQHPGDILREMFLPALRESTADMLAIVEDADLVVSHTLVSGGRLAAEMHGVPWVSAVMQPMGYLSAHEPPVVGPPWIAAILRRAGPRATWLSHRMVRGITGRWLADWHVLRAELGLPKVDDHPVWSGQHSPLRSLGLFPRVLGRPQADWPASARITGFPFFRQDRSLLSDDLREFIAQGEPPLVFTLGTTAVHDPGEFYEESAAAALDLGCRAILVTGPRDLERLNSMSASIRAVAYAPHDLLFPHAKAIVHQAGIGTLSEALRAGKPMLIMPYGHDQADNAWRAERLGVARVVPRRHYRRDAVQRALRTLLDDDSVRPAAARVAKSLAEEEGAETAAEYIASALSGRGVRTLARAGLC